MNKKSALILIDLLVDFTQKDGRVYYEAADAIIPTCKVLLDKAREAGLLIVFIQHVYRKNKVDANLNAMRPCCIEGSGGELIDPRLPIDLEKDYVIKKRRYSAFYGTDLDLVLREHDIKTVFIGGVKTNNCVNATVLDSYYRNYETIVVRDCVTTNDETVNTVYLNDIERYLGKVMTLQDALNTFEKGK